MADETPVTPSTEMTPTDKTISLTGGPGGMQPPAPTDPDYGMQDMTKVPVNPFTNKYEPPPADKLPPDADVAAAKAQSKKNALGRMMDALTAPGMLLDPASADTGASRSELAIEKDAPALKAARLLHERGLFDVGTATGAEDATSKGFSRFATGMIRPESLLLLTGGGLFEGIPQVARAGMSAVFGAQMAHQLVQQSPEFVNAVKQQDWNKAVEIGSEMIPTAAMTFQTGLHAFTEGAGAVHGAGAKARGNMAARAEARITEAKTGKVITIRPDSQTLPAGPDPDKFAEAGGKLVSQPAPVSADAETPKTTEAVEKPVEPVEKGAAAPNPVEDIIMSDKIKGKKVRGATPKAKPVAQPTDSKLLYHYTTRPFEEFDPMIGGAGGDFGTHLGTTPEQAHGRMQGAPDSPEMVGEDVGGHVRPVYADIQNPIRLEDHGGFSPRSIAQRLWERGTLSDDEYESMRDDYGVVHPEALRDMLEQKGYDGAVYLNRTEGVSDAAASTAQDTIGLSDKKFTKMHPDIKGNDSYIAFRPEQITHKYALPPHPEAFAEHGGKFVGKAPEPAAPTEPYHPDLQKVTELPGVTVHTDPSQIASAGHFVAPDGKFIRLPPGMAHNDAIEQALGIGRKFLEPETMANDPRIQFIDDTKAVRIRPGSDKAGTTLHMSVPKDGSITPAQIESLKQGVAKSLGYGNIMMETSENPRDLKTAYKELATDTDIEPMLKEIGVHPDQKDIISKERIEEAPHKSMYVMEVMDDDGQRIEKIAAHTNNEAMKIARKKFPTADISRHPEMDETHVPSTKYEVPPKKRIKMPPSGGRAEEDTEAHEVAHALVALQGGLETGGIVSSHHPSLPSDARAAHFLKGAGIRDPETGKIRAEKRTAVLASGLAGIASDELRGLPRAANHNFDLREGGDGAHAYQILTEAGFTHEAAMAEMHRLIDENIQTLNHPAYTSVVNENLGFREKDLSRQFHYSPERLQNMNAEIDRRKANGEAKGLDNRPSNGPTAEGRTGDVAEGEGGISKTDSGVAPKKDIVSEEKIKKPDDSKEMTPELAQQIADSHAANGGSTFNLTHGDLAGTDNYAVSTHPDRGLVLNHPPTAQDIQAFATKNADLLKNPEKSLGTWHDTDAGQHTLDVSTTLPDREKAIALGIKHNQKAIYHLKTNELIDTGGTGEAPPLVQADKVTGSSVPLMDKPLTVQPSSAEAAIKTVDVAQALNAFTKDATGRAMLMQDSTPQEMIDRAVPILEDEMRYQLAQNNAGESWYKEDMVKHDAIATQMRPELKDPAKLSIFKWNEAILSSGQKPFRNFKANMLAWDEYQKTGKFSPLSVALGEAGPKIWHAYRNSGLVWEKFKKTPEFKALVPEGATVSWGPRGPVAYGHAIENLNRLVSERGEQGASDWLLSKHPISELRQYNKDVPGIMKNDQFGFHILGPKRGSFGANLHGLETEFTADMWVARTWNRMMGTIEFGVDGKTGEMAISSDAPRSGKERDIMKQSFQAAADRIGKPLSAAQAIQWYYEQGLYGQHGVPKESWSFSDAAKRVMEEENAAKQGPGNADDAEPVKGKGGRANKERPDAKSGGVAERGGGNPQGVSAEDTGGAEGSEDVGEPSFDFGANEKPVVAQSRVSKATPKQQAANDVKNAAMVKALRGLRNPGKQ